MSLTSPLPLNCEKWQGTCNSYQSPARIIFCILRTNVSVNSRIYQKIFNITEGMFSLCVAFSMKILYVLYKESLIERIYLLEESLSINYTFIRFSNVMKSFSFSRFSNVYVLSQQFFTADEIPRSKRSQSSILRKIKNPC